MIEVLDLYIVAEKTKYRIRDNVVIQRDTYQEHPILLWDKENCGLIDMSNIAFIAEKVPLTLPL